MNQVLRWGAYITFFGFLFIGIGITFGPYLYFGVGWFVLAIGVPLSFVGLDMDLKSARAGATRGAKDEPEAAPVVARKAPKVDSEYVCSDCGGDLPMDAKVCPHCGAKIED